MNPIFLSLALVCIFEGAYVWFAMRTDGWRRWVTPLGLIAVFIVQAVLVSLAMGTPRPAWVMAWWGGQYQVVAKAWTEGEAFYLWLAPLDEGQPLSMSLPWDAQQADEATKALSEIWGMNDIPTIDTGQSSFGWSDGRSIVDRTYPAPLPDKTGE